LKNILFVCTGNSCRSVMAEGLFRKYADNRPGEFAVASAGISAPDGFPATADTLHVLDDEGIDMTGHRSQRLTPELVDEADKIYVMERIHKDWILRTMPHAGAKVELLSRYSTDAALGGGMVDIPDPIRMSPSFYRNVLAVIQNCVRNLADTLH
jgi:protein-tyrosine-phosphatase